MSNEKKSLLNVKLKPEFIKVMKVAGIGVVVMIVIIGMSISALKNATSKDNGSSVPQVGQDESKAINDDPNTRKKMVEKDVEEAKVASNSGGSFTPVTMGAEVDVNANNPTKKPDEFDLANHSVDPAKIGDSSKFEMPAFPSDPNVARKTSDQNDKFQFSQPDYGGVTDQSQAGFTSEFINGKTVNIPNDPVKRAEMLAQLQKEAEIEFAAKEAKRHFDSKMARIGNIAEFVASNDAYVETKSYSYTPSKTTMNNGLNGLAGAVDQAIPPTVAASSVVQASADDVMVIKTGERVYVNIDTSINTDQSPELFGQILSGRARGWTLFGRATQNTDYTVGINFDTVSLPDGRSMPITAMAIDPETGGLSVSGNVNHKIFERFVIPVLAGGAGKYGDLMSQVGTTYTPNSITPIIPGVPGTITNNMNMSQVRNAAIGGGVKNLADSLSTQSKGVKPSTTTKRNLGIEVIFLKEVIVKETNLHK